MGQKGYNLTEFLDRCRRTNWTWNLELQVRWRIKVKSRKKEEVKSKNKFFFFFFSFPYKHVAPLSFLASVSSKKPYPVNKLTVIFFSLCPFEGLAVALASDWTVQQRSRSGSLSGISRHFSEVRFFLQLLSFSTLRCESGRLFASLWSFIVWFCETRGSEVRRTVNGWK